jgi:hypothetical protein
MIKRIPSSIREKAQISIDPNAMGVKMSRRARRNLIALSYIDYYSRAWLWAIGHR